MDKIPRFLKNNKNNKINTKIKTRFIESFSIKTKISIPRSLNMGKINMFFKKFKNNLKIKTRLMATFLIMAILPIIIVGSFSYIIAENTVEKKVAVFSQQLLNQISLNVSSFINEYSNKSTLVITNSTVAKLMSEINPDNYSYDDIAKGKEVEEILKSIASSDINISTFCIFQQNGKTLGTVAPHLQDYFKNKFKDSSTYKEISKSDGQIFWVADLNNNNTEVFLMREYKDMLRGRDNGIFIMAVKTGVFKDLFEKMQLDKNNNIQIVDKDKNIVFNVDDKNTSNEALSNIINEVYKLKLSGNFVKDSNLITFSSCINGWKIISEVPMSSLISDIRLSGIFTLIIGVVCGIIALIIGLFIALGIVNPINTIMKLMKKAEDGDLTVILDYKKLDEIGNLSNSFNIMIDKIKKLISDARQVSNAVLKDIEDVTIISNESAEATEQIAMAIGEIATGAMEQAKSSSETIDQIRVLAEKIDAVREGTKKVKDIANETKNIGTSSILVVSELNQRTRESLQMAHEINTDICELNDSSKEIEKIIEVIKSISDQTSLLSLNASIEAARVGNAGRGFAVVANEIRKLSEESKEATRMIASIVTNIQKKTGNTVKLVEKANDIFKEQEKSVNNTDKVFKNIIKSTESISLELETVSMAMSDMNNYKEKTIKSVESIVYFAEESSAATEEVLASVENQNQSSKKLASLSTELHEAIQVLNKSMIIFKT